MVNFRVKSIFFCFAFILFLFQFARSQEPKTNENFLRETIAGLLNESISEVMSRIDDTVYLKNEGKHPASWLLEEELVSYLIENKKEVFLLDSTRFSYSEFSFSKNTKILSYRLTELGISYPKVNSKSFLSRKVITREGRVATFFYLIDATSGEILWQTREEKIKFDKVDVGDLKRVENKNFPFLWAELPSNATKKYVEPAIVTAVVGGLIYLFFANR